MGSEMCIRDSPSCSAHQSTGRTSRPDSTSDRAAAPLSCAESIAGDWVAVTAHHRPLLLSVESLVGGTQFALPSLTRKGDLGGRSHADCPSTSSEAAGGALLRFTPRPRSAPRSAARFPLAGASVPVSAIESCEHRKWTCTAGGDFQSDLRYRAASSLPPSGPRRTTSRSPSLTPRSNKPAPSWAILCAHCPPAASWSPLPY